VIVAVATAAVVIDAWRDPGDLAALVGDQVQLEYVVRSEHPAQPGAGELLLEVRSYWKGELSGGSSGAIGECSSGTEWIQGSDWGIWIGRDSGWWADRPKGTPVVSHRNDIDGPVRLTIRLDEHGHASWERGLQRDGC
jgi:hypothetical protein